MSPTSATRAEARSSSSFRKASTHVVTSPSKASATCCASERRPGVATVPHRAATCCTVLQLQAGVADMRWTLCGTGCIGRSNVASASARERARREGHAALGGGWPYRMLHCMHISESESAAQPRSFNDDRMLQPHGLRPHDHARWRSLCELSPDWRCPRCRRCGCTETCAKGDDYSRRDQSSRTHTYTHACTHTCIPATVRSTWQRMPV